VLIPKAIHVEGTVYRRRIANINAVVGSRKRTRFLMTYTINGFAIWKKVYLKNDFDPGWPSVSTGPQAMIGEAARITSPRASHFLLGRTHIVAAVSCNRIVPGNVAFLLCMCFYTVLLKAGPSSGLSPYQGGLPMKQPLYDRLSENEMYKTTGSLFGSIQIIWPQTAQ